MSSKSTQDGQWFPAAVVINFVIALAGCSLIIQVQKSNKI
jgi:hypothetical protein